MIMFTYFECLQVGAYGMSIALRKVREGSANVFAVQMGRTLRMVKAEFHRGALIPHDAYANVDVACFKDEVHLNDRGKQILMEYILREAMWQGFAIKTSVELH